MAAKDFQTQASKGQGLDVQGVLNDIKKAKAEIAFINSITNGFNLQLAKNAFKVKTMEIASHYFKLASYFYQEKQLLKGDDYWKKSLRSFKACSDISCGILMVDYQNWLDLTQCYFYRVELSRRNIHNISREERITCMKEGFASACRALEVIRTPQARFFKFMALQLMEEMGLSISESSLDCLKDYLDHHPEPFSEEYIEKAITFGEQKEKQGLLEEAKKWFLFLLQNKPNAITYLYAGKVFDHLGKGIEALSYFQKALEIEPENLEIRLWHVAQKAKNIISEMRTYTFPVKQEKIEEVVDVFNQFFSTFFDCEGHLPKRTSNYITLNQLADHFYSSLLPQISIILLQLQQYPFALSLYQKMLNAFSAFVQLGVLKESDKLSVHSTIGMINLMLGEVTKAEYHLFQAKTLNPSHLATYKNLVVVYADLKDESKLESLWKEIEPFLNQPEFQNSKWLLSGILFNLGSAYIMLRENNFKKGQQFYRLSLEQDKNNWDTRLHLARTLVFTEDLQGALECLIDYANRESGPDSPFVEFPKRDFQVYFCLAGISAILGDLSNAEKWAIEAGKTSIDPQETKNLQAYLKALKDKKTDKIALHEEIRTSIRKMEFSCRVGKIIDQKSISIHPGTIVGYHGTTDLFASDFKKGVQPRERNIGQFKGTGFYIASNKDIACYFAMKKARDEGKGKPVLLQIYATQDLVGKGIEMGDKINKEMNSRYDFVQAPIDGWEAFNQYYIFENSLGKLKPSDDITSVDWTEEEYNKFMKDWIRSRCV